MKCCASEEFRVLGFQRKIQYYRPKIVCFNGKKAAKVCLNKKHVEYGLQKKQIGFTRLFVAPSTSGTAKRWWNQGWWQKPSIYIKYFGLSFEVAQREKN